MSRLVLVRHGQTVWHAENRYAGNTDIALTPEGLAQAERLGALGSGSWAGVGVELAVAAGAADGGAVCASTGLALRVDARLTELSFGRGEGLTGAEMEARFPVERAAFVRDPVTHFLPGAEDPVEAARRGVEALALIAAEAPDGRSLVVAHSTLLRLVLCRVLEIPLARYRDRFPHFANGAITELEWTDRGASLLSLNVPVAG